MIGFWIFLIVLVICITVVLCFLFYNSEGLETWRLISRLDEIDKHIVMIGKILEKQSDKEEGVDHVR